MLDGIDADRVAAWDGALASAKTYADGLAVNYDEKGAADKAFSAATANTASQIEALNLENSYDEKGAAAQALKDAKEYTDDAIEELDLANSYDAKGDAAQALEDAKKYTDDVIEELDLKNSYDAKGAADEAFTAATANTASQIEALDLKNSYDEKGAAAQALEDAKDYADGLVENLKPYEGGTAVDITDYTVNVKVAADSANKKNFIEVNASNELEMSAITLDAAITSKDIVIEGGAWETAVKAVFTGGTVPAGTTWESFLESMLCVEKWAPSVALSESFVVSCGAPGAGITGAEHNKSYEVGTKVTLSGVNAKTTTASQSVTVKEFKGADGKVYGYKVGANGAHVNSSAYTESLTPTKTGSNDALKETFTGFTDANGTAIATVSGKSSLDAVEMYLNDGTNQATVSQTGDTYQSSSAVTGGTLYIATNLKNYYKTNKKDDNTISLSATVTAKTATNSSTYKVTGYRNTFYGVTFSGDTCDAAFIRTLTKTNKEMAANGEISVTTADGTSGNRMVIASPRTLKSVKNATATQDITTTLTNTHQVIQVPGLNGYKPIDYNVYDFTWKEAFGADTWKIIFN